MGALEPLLLRPASAAAERAPAKGPPTRRSPKREARAEAGAEAERARRSWHSFQGAAAAAEAEARRLGQVLRHFADAGDVVRKGWEALVDAAWERHRLFVTWRDEYAAAAPVSDAAGLAAALAPEEALGRLEALEGERGRGGEVGAGEPGAGEPGAGRAAVGAWARLP